MSTISESDLRFIKELAEAMQEEYYNNIDEAEAIINKVKSYSDSQDERTNTINADIRNKLSPIKNLIAILESSNLPYHQNNDMHKLAEKEIEQCKASINYLIAI